MASIVKVLVADEQDVMRAGLKSFLARTKIKVVAEAKSQREALRFMQKHKPDLILLDVHLDDGYGFETLDRIKEKKETQPVLMWSSIDNPTYVARSYALGAGGYLPRTAGRSETVAAIKAVAAGGEAWTPDHFEKIIDRCPRPKNLKEKITPREFDVLRQLAYGLPNREIAMALEISYETVKEHVQHILQKLGATDRTEVAVWAVRKKLA